MGIDKDKSQLTAATELRRHAEERLRAKTAQLHLPRNEEETQSLVHELEVHQIELEMQNAEFRQARDEAEAALEKYADLYDFAPVGYFTLDHEGHIRSVNFTGASLLGVERSRLLGLRFGLFVTVDARLFFSEFLGKVFTKRAKEVCEVALLKEGNSPLFVRIEGVAAASGQECRIASIDITERKRAEEELRESEEQFRALADSIPNLAWWANGDGYIKWYNQRWYDYTGTVPEQMEGWGWQSVHDPSKLPKVLERWQASIATGEPFDMTFPLRGADGVFHPFLTRVIPLKDAAGRVLQWFGTNTDISALKQAEEQVKASLAEKEVMLREIHHRVKNNLQVISSLVSLQTDGTTDDTVREVLRDVIYRVRSMALVHEKLYQSESFSLIDFAEYVRGLFGYLWRAHGAAAARVRMTLDLEPVSLPMDIALPCGLILNELAGNALKHAFRGRAEGEVAVSLHSPAEGCISLCLRDNGVGLPEGLDWRQARSLGLRLVQMLVGQLNATVEVSGLGGTEFRITLTLPQTAKNGEPLHE